MTFREYYVNFIQIKDHQIADGWGWFVDIELLSETNKSNPIQIQIQNENQKYDKHSKV